MKDMPIVPVSTEVFNTLVKHPDVIASFTEYKSTSEPMRLRDSEKANMVRQLKFGGIIFQERA